MLLAWPRSGIRQGPVVGRPTRRCSDGGGGQAGDVGAGDRAGAGRTTLSAFARSAIGRDWCRAPVEEGGAAADDDVEETALLSASTGLT